VAEPAVERLRTAAANMEDIEGTFLTVLRDEARADEVGPMAQHVARARQEFASAMDDPVIVRLCDESSEVART